MGQKVSRGLVSRLEGNLQKARAKMDHQMREEVRKKTALGKFTDPHALHSGFQRGEGPTQHPNDLMQEKFLQQQHGANTEKQEMPEELVKFLNDVGPLERKVDEGLTSPRLRGKLKQEELATQRELNSQRKVRDMPILEGNTEFVTSRTTNFSTAEPEEEEENLGVTDVELYELILLGKISGKQLDEDQQKQMNLCRDYLGLPVIMKDSTDKSYVGAWSDQVEDLKAIKLEVVPNDRVKVVMSTFLEKSKATP